MADSQTAELTRKGKLNEYTVNIYIYLSFSFWRMIEDRLIKFGEM